MQIEQDAAKLAAKAEAAKRQQEQLAHENAARLQARKVRLPLMCRIPKNLVGPGKQAPCCLKLLLLKCVDVRELGQTLIACHFMLVIPFLNFLDVHLQAEAAKSRAQDEQLMQQTLATLAQQEEERREKVRKDRGIVC